MIKKNNSIENITRLSEIFKKAGLNQRNSFELRLASAWFSGLLYESLGWYKEASRSYYSLGELYEYDLSVSTLKWSGLYNDLREDALEDKREHDVEYEEYFNRVIGDIRSEVEQPCDRDDFLDIPEYRSSENYLEQNVPNPFSSITEIKYYLAESAYVRVSITDILGTELEVLVDEWQSSGQHSITFNNNNYSNGLYLYRLDVGEDHLVKFMCIVK